MASETSSAAVGRCRQSQVTITAGDSADAKYDSLATLWRGADSAKAMVDSEVTAERDSNGPCYEETTVEVCVKMVVCRKFVTHQISRATGKVVQSSTRMEEEPPTLLNVHTYKTTANPAGQSASPVIATATPVSVAKRRPGRPRKNPLPQRPAVASTTSSSESVKPSEQMQEGENKERASAADDSPNAPVTDNDSDTKFKAGIRSKWLLETEVPASTKQRAVGKRGNPGRDRPSRAIKKPRKYLDGYRDEDVKTEAEVTDDTPADQGEEGEGEEGEDAAGGENKEAKVAEQAEDDGKDGGADGGSRDQGDAAQSLHCPKCQRRFTTVSNCQRHIVKDSCSYHLQCSFCEKFFSSRSLLERHIESHRDADRPDSFRCNDCNRTYATRNGFLKHKRQGTCYKRDVFHEDGTQGQFECDVCRTRFTTQSLLSLHKEKVHENPNQEYKCLDCGRVFYSKLGYNKHAARKSCTLPFECRVCGKKYSNKAKESFKSHMRHHLAEASGVQYQCEDCGRVYMTDMALKKHRLSHSAHRPFKCSICPKTFPMRYMVRDHERIHSGEKPFLCSLCGSPFGNRGHLYRHMRSHTLGTLHKRGRPRKYPQILLKIKGEGAEPQAEGAAPQGDMGVVTIKGDPASSLEGGEGAGEGEVSGVGPGPTYITVHTVDGGVTDPTAQGVVGGEGGLQHVVMETAEGLTDSVVLQVIRDLTGATAVYQQVAETPESDGTALAGGSHTPHIIISAPQGSGQQATVLEAATSSSSQGEAVILADHPPNIIMSTADVDSQQSHIVVTASTHSDSVMTQTQ